MIKDTKTISFRPRNYNLSLNHLKYRDHHCSSGSQELDSFVVGDVTRAADTDVESENDTI